MIKIALEWEDGNHRGLSLSVSEAPSPRKLRNDSPGIMPAASRLVCVCISWFPFPFCQPTPLPPAPLLWPSQIPGIPTKSEGLDILVQNCLSSKPTSTQEGLISLPIFLPSFLPPSLPPSLPSFLPSFLPSSLPPSRFGVSHGTGVARHHILRV